MPATRSSISSTTGRRRRKSNGKIERWHKSLKGECIRPQVPLSLDDARRLVERFVTHYNTLRLHSAIGYVTPADKLLGLEDVIHAERDRKFSSHKSGESPIGERKGFLVHDLQSEPLVSQDQEGAHAFTEEPVYDYLPRSP
ncbi:MAG: transposase [Anaerolineae bacterium]